MAGDWIKMRVDLADDPAVIGMASYLKIDEYEVIGRLHKLWSWADKHTTDGFVPHINGKWIDKHLDKSGFSSQMISVGWLSISSNGVTFPLFDRHNGKSAKSRAENTERARLSRKVSDKSSTKIACLSQEKCDESVTREEKRREEVNNTTPVGFAEFWSAYPKKVGKGAAEKAWKKSKANLDVVLAAINSQASSDQWRKEGGQYIPNPATWINERRWEDGVSGQVENPDELITLPNGQQITRSRQKWLMDMMS